VPRLDVGADEYGDDDELDVWSSFSSEAPVWKDDEVTEADVPVADQHDRRTTGQQRRISGQVPRTTGQHRRVSGEAEVAAREPSRITIGTDPSGIPRRARTDRSSSREQHRRRPRAGRARPLRPSPGATCRRRSRRAAPRCGVPRRD
jgi:phosphatidate cytidylyltransferase